MKYRKFGKFIIKKFIKKIDHHSIIFFFLVGYSINMSNLQQNEQIRRDSLQGRRKKNEKSQNQFQNGLMHIGRMDKGQRTDLSQTKKIQNIVKNIFQIKIEQIKKNTNLLQNILAQVKKKKEIN